MKIKTRHYRQGFYESRVLRPSVGHISTVVR